MRYSNLFSKTKRDAPADLIDPTVRLAYRAGLIRPAEPGQFLYLPLAANVISQMHLMLRGDLNELGAQELRGAEVNLDALAFGEIQSYKQMPARVYWHSSGMTRLYLASLETSQTAALETQNTFEKLAMDFFEYAGVAPDVAQDSPLASVWYSKNPQLALQVLKSSNGPYAATRSTATPFKSTVQESLMPLEQVETPHCDTIEALARLLDVPTSRTAKAVFYSTGERVVFAVVRGDLQIDEDKIKRALGIETLRWATPEEIIRAGGVPGYASPIGIRGATIIVDDSVANSPNLVAGANREGYHLLNTNVPRDYQPDITRDIALARVGDTSPDGIGQLELVRGTELGSITMPRELNATFLDVNGKAKKMWVVTVELELGLVMLAHLGANHDEKGIVWSRALAPYDVYIVALNADKPEVAAALAQVDKALDRAGLEGLVDDRNESAGVKFNDADLLGLPLRITVGPKTVARGGVELKSRLGSDARLVTTEALGAELDKWIGV